jgi:hypothetical protein
MISTVCPGLDRLIQFLETPSSGVEDEAIVGHVEGCEACRRELERLALATELSGLRAAGTARATSADVSFLRHLKELDLRERSVSSTANGRSQSGMSPEGFALSGQTKIVE